MTMRKKAIEAKWIQMSGKPNKYFLAKPRASRKRIGNNVKDQPTLDKLGSLCYSDNIVHKGSGSYTLPPTYPTFDPNWKIDHSQTNGRWHVRCPRQDSSCPSWNFKLF
jgi:hypothetical protein